jgi:hypothetical protein
MGTLTPVMHPWFGMGTVRVVDLGNNPHGQVRRTVGLMRQRVEEDAQDPWFQQHTAKVLGLVQGMGEVEIANRAWSHVKRHMEFVQDRDLAAGLEGVIPQAADAIEWSMRPKTTGQYVEQGIAVGDCDDFQEYLAGLLAGAGVRCSFVTVAANEEDPGQETHVYVRAYPVDGGMVALDASHGEYAGWEVENRFNRLSEWPVNGSGNGGGQDGVQWATWALVGIAATALWVEGSKRGWAL